VAWNQRNHTNLTTPVPINKPYFQNRELDLTKLHSMPHSTVFLDQVRGPLPTSSPCILLNLKGLHSHNVLVPMFSRVKHVHAIPTNSYEINFNNPNLRFTVHKLYPFLLVSPPRNPVGTFFPTYLLHAFPANCSIRLSLRFARSTN
jgi:hypothetical protein